MQRRRGVLTPQRRQGVLDDTAGELVDVRNAVGLEGAAPREHREGGRAQGVDVGGRVGRAHPHQLLGGSPGHAHPPQLLGSLRATHGGDAEVGEHRAAVGGEQNVGGLDVPVDDAGPVSGLHRSGDLDRRGQGLSDIEGTLAQDGAQLRRRAVLHDQEGVAVGGDARAVDGQDGRVGGDPRHEVRLRLEAGGGLVLHVSVHDLDRDLAAGHVLLEEVDRGVASRSESLQVREPGDDRRRSLVIQHQGRFSKARV